jgi:acetyl-CoA carboxylase carboxyl transferase subunit beta
MARGSWFGRQKRNGASQSNVPDGLWKKCLRAGCGEIHFNRDLERNLYVCPKCDYHFRLGVKERLALTLDEDSFEELDAGITARDPLGFPEYADRISRARTETGLVDAVVTGTGRIEGRPLVIGVADFGFMGSSMGSVVGEKLVRAMEHGVRARLPVVLFTASGGARMQEGLLSLMQMAKTSAGVALMDRAAVPYFVVLTDPTMAGVYASYASLGDIILAEPGALVGFAGRRVGNQDVGMKLPEDFQTAEYQYRCGMVDWIVPRKEMRVTLANLLAFFGEERANAQQSA